MIAPKKVYCIDSGLRNVSSFKFSEDLGRAIENIVYIELRRRYSQAAIYYWKNKGEVDFVIKEGIKVKSLIQVCYSLDDTKTIVYKPLWKWLLGFGIYDFIPLYGSSGIWMI